MALRLPLISASTIPASVVARSATTAVAVTNSTLDAVSEPGFYEHLNALGDRLYSGMREIMDRHGIEAWVQGVGARFGLLFGLDREPRNYRDIAGQDMDKMRAFHLACLRRGVYLHFKSPHHGFAIAHSMADIEETLDVMDSAAAEIR